MNRIKLLREEFGYTQQELADKINRAKSSIAMYENGSKKPSYNILFDLSKVFNCSIDYIVGNSDNRNSAETSAPIDAIPLLGRIAAGSPIFADENIESYMPVMPSILSKNSINDLFYLRVYGESMNERIPNNSYVLIKKQDYAENDDIVVAIVNGDNEATLKRYHQINDHMIVLKPESNDKSFKEIYIDLKTTDFLIIGKVIGYYIDNV